MPATAALPQTNPKLRLGLPESKVGLLPGAGGTQRLPRLIGASEALQLMLLGRNMDPERAAALGAIHEVVAAEDLIAAAKRWIAEEGSAVQPWDEDRFRAPGGANYSPRGMITWSAANAIYRRETYDNYPAQRAIMSCVFEGLMVPIDVGLEDRGALFHPRGAFRRGRQHDPLLVPVETGTRQTGAPA